MIRSGFIRMGQYDPLPWVPQAGGPINTMLQYNNVTQILLLWLRQPNWFISFDILNETIDFRHLNSWKLYTQIRRGLQTLLAQRPHRALLWPTVNLYMYTGADPGFQVGGGGPDLKKLRRAEGGAKIFGVFRVKNQDFTPKNLIFFPIAEGGAKIFGVFWIRPWLLQHKVTVHLCW